MPIVRIDIQSGKTTEYKRALLRGVRTALTSELGITDDRVTQRVVETPVEDIDVTDIRSDRLTVIEISMLAGRGPELKARVYDAIARRLALEPGVAGHDLIVLVNDPPGECFFLNGKIQCELPGPAETQATVAAERPDAEPMEGTDAP